MPPLTPLDIQHKEFTKAMRGYAMHEVDTFLDQVTEEFTRMQDEIARLREQASSAAPPQPVPVVQQAPPPPPPQPQPVAAEARSGAHQGVLAIVAPIQPIELAELLAVPLAGREPPFFLALDGVEDPHNLGALARSAEAAGCHGLVVPRHRSAPLSAVAVKTSAGALEHLPVAEVPNLARAVEQLRDAGVWCIGLDGTAEDSLFDLQLADEPVCVVVGSEGTGLHRLVRDSCDALVRIPMSGNVESLNASVAGALALFEVRRRRHSPPPP